MSSSNKNKENGLTLHSLAVISGAHIQRLSQTHGDFL